MARTSTQMNKKFICEVKYHPKLCQYALSDNELKSGKWQKTSVSSLFLEMVKVSILFLQFLLFYFLAVVKGKVRAIGTLVLSIVLLFN